MKDCITQCKTSINLTNSPSLWFCKLPDVSRLLTTSKNEVALYTTLWTLHNYLFYTLEAVILGAKPWVTWFANIINKHVCLWRRRAHELLPQAPLQNITRPSKVRISQVFGCCSGKRDGNENIWGKLTSKKVTWAVQVKLTLSQKAFLEASNCREMQLGASCIRMISLTDKFHCFILFQIAVGH